MSQESAPLVSIGIPLYKSRRFLDCIVANIEAIEYAPVEIIISDRHGDADDTIELLKLKFTDDPRVRFISRRDELDWVEHYNSLLETATGEYFFWMPHDDSFPSNYISQLVAELEQNPDTTLAFGYIKTVSLEDTPDSLPVYPLPPLESEEAWSPRVALRLLTSWNLGIPFRGIFRREAVIRDGLYIRPTRGNVLADMYWVFGLSLRARLAFVPACYCVKHYYPTSTHAHWRVGARHMIDAFFVLRSYVRDLSARRRDACHGVATIFCWTLSRLLWIAGNRFLIVSVAKPTLKKTLDAALRFLTGSRVHKHLR